MAEDKSKWMSIGDASKSLGISRDTLRRWEKAGKIKPIRSPTNRRYYTQKILDEAMNAPKKRKAGQKRSKKSLSLGRGPKLALIGLGSFLLAAILGLIILFFLL